MNVGIFGGSFNPVHNGHINLAGCYKESLMLDKILFVPTSTPPHKTAMDLASNEDRIAMLKMAIEGINDFELSSIELERKGISYTYDTILQYKKENPDDDIFLIVGSDMFMSFHKWYKYKEMLQMVVLCTAAREECDSIYEMNEYAQNVLKISRRNYFVSKFPVVIASSTDIRESIKRGERFSPLVSQKVERYILEKGLYFDSTEKQYDALIHSRLSDFRYNHSLCVAKSAVELAKRYDSDAQKANIAGLLHDVMKEEAPAVQLQTIKKADIIMSELEEKSPKLFHAMAGYAYCKDVLKINDKEILHSIYYHTTARENMTLLDKIIFVADFISEDRDYEDVDIMREKAKMSLEWAMLYAMQYTISDLVEKGAAIHPDTINAYNKMIFDKKESE